jgi:tRNA (guanine37-N1)-methyltransferase
VSEQGSSQIAPNVAFGAVTLFPEMFTAISQHGITRRAYQDGRWTLDCVNPRDFAEDNYRTVDDRPYGGGPGMLMLPAPLEAAIQSAKMQLVARGAVAPKVIYLSPQGAPLTHQTVMRLRQESGLVLLCGRYEGIDERLIQRCVDEEISLGDFVLSGGELPAMALMDAVIRQLPGVLNDDASAEQDSFVAGLLDCPHYTRPEVYEGMPVPDVLLSGHHEAIRRWRLKQSLARTRERRPELFAEWRQRLLAQRALNAKVLKVEAQLLAEVEAEAKAAAAVAGVEQCGEQ